MGLMSVYGKDEADRRKVANRLSHPAIFASMVGVEVGEPDLVLSAEHLDRASARLDGLSGHLIGLNTGSGDRWTSKSLPEERVIELACAVDREVAQRTGVRPTFVLLGGPEEHGRHERLFAALAEPVQVFDGTIKNGLLEFAALIDGLDLLITSDSLAMHMGIARRRQVVAFFAPTSAAEIELFGRGVKVESTASDYCSYRESADRSTLTAERLCDAAMTCLEFT
jgi:heptosyltransferase-2